MPTIVVPVEDSCKGSNNSYPNTIGTEGTGISYTVNTQDANAYWVLTSVINCTVSNHWGSNGTTISVTPTNQINTLNYWAFLIQEWQDNNTPPSSEPGPSIAYDGELDARLAANYSLIYGKATASGPFIKSFPAYPTYGLRVFNSSGNTTLDLSSIYPEIYATGTGSSMAPNTTQVISVPGFIPNGSFVPIVFSNNIDESYALVAYYSGNNQFTIQYYRSSGPNTTPGWIVLKL